MKQMPTIERVARAICKEQVPNGNQKFWTLYINEAEAAIAAYLVAESVTTRRKQ